MSDKKYERTSQDQLSHYLAYLDQHPELQASKLDPRNAHKIDDLWAKLADELNALKRPIRDASKWKHSLAHWKYQLRSRARKAKAIKMATGGGPQNSSVNLNEFEEKALQTFGTAAVEGVTSISTLGFGNEAVLEEDDSAGMDVEFLDDENEQSCYSSLDMSSSPVGATSSLRLPSEVQATSSSRVRRIRRGATEDVYGKIIKILEEKNEQDRKAAEYQQKTEEKQQQLQQQIVETQRMMAEALKRLGDGLYAFSKVAESVINKKE